MKVCFLLFIVISVICMCILKVSCSVSLIGPIGLVGIFWRAGPCTYSPVCVSAAWSAGPVRVYLVALLVWVPGRYGSFCLFGSVLACVCLIEQVGGWRCSTIFLVFSALFWRVSTIEMVGGVLNLDFHFLQFAVNCLGGWICAVGISFHHL